MTRHVYIGYLDLAFEQPRSSKCPPFHSPLIIILSLPRLCAELLARVSALSHPIMMRFNVTTNTVWLGRRPAYWPSSSLWRKARMKVSSFLPVLHLAFLACHHDVFYRCQLCRRASLACANPSEVKIRFVIMHCTVRHTGRIGFQT